jgi:hypothetical protein
VRFVPFDRLDSSPNIIVDGAAGPGTVLTLSHWPKSGTPTNLKRDTSAEIVFAYLDSPGSHVKADFVSNNHFDEDGLVGIFALVEPAVSEEHRGLLIDVARAGDFGVYERREAARIAFAISAYADSATSPFPAELFAMPYPQMAGELYRRILEIMPALLTDLGDFRELWRAEDEKLTLSEQLIENGRITIEERPGIEMAVVSIPPDLTAQRVHRFTQGKFEECHPFALHNRTLCTRLFIVQGQRVEFRYRYETWVQFASRKPLLRVDLRTLAEELNREEMSGGVWTFDGVERITPRLHLEGSDTTSIAPASIRTRLEHHLATSPPAWDPYD